MTEWTKQDLATLKQLKTKGISNVRAARTLGRSTAQVQRKVLSFKKLHNLSRGALSRTDFDTRWMAFLKKKNLSLTCSSV